MQFIQTRLAYSFIELQDRCSTLNMTQGKLETSSYKEKQKSERASKPTICWQHAPYLFKINIIVYFCSILYDGVFLPFSKGGRNSPTFQRR